MEFRYELVVFDLDGTLINSLPDISAAGNALMNLMDKGAPSEKGRENSFNGSEKGGKLASLEMLSAYSVG